MFIIIKNKKEIDMEVISAAIDGIADVGKYLRKVFLVITLNNFLCCRYDFGSVFGLYHADTDNGLNAASGWLLDIRFIHPYSIELDQNILVVL